MLPWRYVTAEVAALDVLNPVRPSIWCGAFAPVPYAACSPQDVVDGASVRMLALGEDIVKVVPPCRQEALRDDAEPRRPAQPTRWRHHFAELWLRHVPVHVGRPRVAGEMAVHTSVGIDHGNEHTAWVAG
eukprot:86875-Chlamydomonas_euryale.AAC.6